MMPAELVPRAVAVPPDSVTQTPDLSDERSTIEMFEIFVHVTLTN
jgi:hypothetical protein